MRYIIELSNEYFLKIGIISLVYILFETKLSLHGNFGTFVKVIFWDKWRDVGIKINQSRENITDQ